jgi:UDP-N-acetylglucosamine 4,6-dehydratase
MDENHHLDGKTILVTGGTGSFGRTFVGHLLKKHSPRKVIVFSRDELKQHEMRQAHPDSGESPMRYFIGDVRDRERLSRAFHGVDVVVHAAALKQVPACEYNPFEAVLTNIIGAKNVIDAAIDHGVERVIAVSTDKAVNPINVYGATKLCGEKLFIQGNSYAGGKVTRFSCVRYGNVVGSRGSVIPIFMQQRENGRVTVTDKRMTRFWMTLEQGVELVARCIGLMQGGEVFVPCIPSMKIMDLVEAIAPGCAVDVSGIRPGEKLHEVLVSQDEARHTVLYKDMFVIMPQQHGWGRPSFADGEPLKDGFVFSSDTNELWLSKDDLRHMVERLPLANQLAT